jgi:hypothetical protein
MREEIKLFRKDKGLNRNLYKTRKKKAIRIAGELKDKQAHLEVFLDTEYGGQGEIL